jgi:hypothetical protein
MERISPVSRLTTREDGQTVVRKRAMPALHVDTPTVGMQLLFQPVGAGRIASHKIPLDNPTQQLSAHQPRQALPHRVSYTQKPLW